MNQTGCTNPNLEYSYDPSVLLFPFLQQYIAMGQPRRGETPGGEGNGNKQGGCSSQRGAQVLHHASAWQGTAENTVQKAFKNIHLKLIFLARKTEFPHSFRVGICLPL